MRIEIKDSWLKANINKPKRLYKEYQTFVGKINHVNNMFYIHRMLNIPMSEETKNLCDAKIKNYLKQMDLLFFVITKRIIPDDKQRLYYRHRIDDVDLGNVENFVYIHEYLHKFIFGKYYVIK